MNLNNCCSHCGHFHLTNMFQIYCKNSPTFSAALSSEKKKVVKCLPLPQKPANFLSTKILLWKISLL